MVYNVSMRNNKGQFVKGIHAHPETEFKKGQHWRMPAQFRDKEYLVDEYINKQRSTGEIAEEHGCTPAAIIFWLKKHGIPRRDTSEARAIKHWGATGEANPMHGKTGSSNPNWRGGCTPERQAFYCSAEWADASREVWRRDQRTCQRCRTVWINGASFHIHHIVSFAVVELRAEVSNLVLLCEDCHNWVHSRKNKNKDFIEER
jgi:5-methylcytosine-specific restriction protein A